MNKLCVQLQPNLAPELDFPSLVSRLCGIGDEGGHVRVSDGHDNGHYINIDFDSTSIGNLWQRVREELCANATLLRCSIVICQGDAGWDDYWLLHHLDPTQLLDELP
jgi:hypothetical protein